MERDFSLSEYAYNLDISYIAQEPVSARDQSRLLVVSCGKGVVKEGVFSNLLELLLPGDLLVLNDTRVIKARLFVKRASGGKVEIFLLKEIRPNLWQALVSPGKRGQVGEKFSFCQEGLEARVIEILSTGERLIEFSLPCKDWIEKQGKTPLPPYIKKELDNDEKYQTVYSQKQGAVAAPTAGLHFTNDLLQRIAKKGVEIVYLTLHCGLATFQPVKVEDIRRHRMHTELIEISQDTADKISRAKKEGRRVIAVGTTSVRTLESLASFAAAKTKKLSAFSGETNLYIVPGYKFKLVDAIITNFHTPRSSNLILISAFAGRECIQQSYQYAISHKFRFFSFGDAMFISRGHHL